MQTKIDSFPAVLVAAPPVTQTVAGNTQISPSNGAIVSDAKLKASAHDIKPRGEKGAAAKQTVASAHSCEKILDDQRHVCINEAPICKPFSSADGKDIVKRGSTRSGRYLFYIAARFRPAMGGRLGTLTKLDSENPVLYFDFPSGRLRLIGSLVFPKAKYLLLKFGSKEVLCEDTFDCMVMFTKMHWVGKHDANPSEEPLPFPEELQEAIEREHPLQGEKEAINEDVDDENGTQQSTAKRKRDEVMTGEAADPSDGCLTASQSTAGCTQQSQTASPSRQPKGTGSKAKRRASAATTAIIELSESEADHAEVIGGTCLSQPRPSRQSKTAARQRMSQQHDSGDSSHSDPASDDDDEESS